ncbi:hypothetical protein [Sphingobium yanoikuyae]|uniref:hypothetical protein n=1 Tax=Sphingobium yanoikuyae TaxID=13690 RepID=UPI00345ECDF0
MIISHIPWDKLRQRAGGLAFALVLNAILLLALLTMAPHIDPKKVEDRNPVSFDIEPAKQANKEKSKAQKAEKRERDTAAPKQKSEPVVTPPRPVETPTVQPPSPFPFITLDSRQMAAADIGKMEKKTAGVGDSGTGNAKAIVGPGEGPGGVQLFEAEWYRRPTHAELSTYLPANAPAQGYGLVACKTIDHYHVENCQMISEYPTGSGFGRAVRLAAWQFLVRPPRVDGKPQVGAWVRIRIDYTRTVIGGAAGADDDGR